MIIKIYIMDDEVRAFFHSKRHEKRKWGVKPLKKITVERMSGALACQRGHSSPRSKNESI